MTILQVYLKSPGISIQIGKQGRYEVMFQGWSGVGEGQDGKHGWRTQWASPRKGSKQEERLRITFVCEKNHSSLCARYSVLGTESKNTMRV